MIRHAWTLSDLFDAAGDDAWRLEGRIVVNTETLEMTNQQGEPIPTPCWDWTGYRVRESYGSIRWPHPDGKKTNDGRNPWARVHRITYHLLADRSEPIWHVRPEDTKPLVLDHFACDRPPCCNPAHLRLKSNRENTVRGDSCIGGASRFLGVSWHKRGRKWTAQFRLPGTSRHLGLFAVEEDAARAYDAKVVELYGPGATTNESLGLLGPVADPVAYLDWIEQQLFDPEEDA